MLSKYLSSRIRLRNSKTDKIRNTILNKKEIDILITFEIFKD